MCCLKWLLNHHQVLVTGYWLLNPCQKPPSTAWTWCFCWLAGLFLIFWLLINPVNTVHSEGINLLSWRWYVLVLCSVLLLLHCTLVDLCGMQSSRSVFWGLGLFFPYFFHPLRLCVILSFLDELLMSKSSDEGEKSGTWGLMVLVSWQGRSSSLQ